MVGLKTRISGQELYKIVKELCEFGYRRAGTPAAEKAEKYIYQKLEEAGLPEVKLETFNFTRWWAEKHELTIISKDTISVPSDQNIETFPIWFSGSTRPGGITAEMVYAGYGTATDFETIDVRDKIVLIDSRMILNFYPTFAVFGSLNLAKEKGALGLVIINGSPLDAVSYIFIGAGIEGWENRLPALSVNNDDGNYLRSLCIKNEEKLTVKLIEEVKTESAKSNIVIGKLPGKTDDIILIGTHTDSTFTGAVDNAGANAGLIALAKHYAQVPLEKRKKTMVFAGWTGHEVAFLGVTNFVKMHKDMFDKIATFIMLDGFGSKGWYNQADGGAVETGLDEKRGLFISDNPVLIPFILEATLKHNLLPAAYVSAKSLPVSDLGPFIAAGVPSIMLIGKPIWYHTKYDTPDKCTPDQLERTAKAHIDIIDKIHETPTQQIKDADGKLQDIKKFITKRKETSPPTCSFTVTPHPVIEGKPAIFHVTVFTAPESIILDLNWNFGDESTGTLPIAIHTYNRADTYKVTLEYTDSAGSKGSTSRLVRVIKKQS
ncbi:MAG: M28 family peptidase [Candidatus Jordarchaeum sp.]|uniref:M28 family peptidase n=1 Tax=Candidatus Jordarchaeum sp. TaxID=2823881 RepID=UPI00404ABF6F